jgi:DNA-binding transcriptional ArsR family regulator
MVTLYCNMSLDLAFAALSDPTRRRVVGLLGVRPRKAGELASAFPVSRPAVSKHLRVLREAGLVEAEKVGRVQVYRLRPGGIAEASKWMEKTGRFWGSTLEAFRRHVDEEVEG